MPDVVSRNVSLLLHTCVDMFKVSLTLCDSPLPIFKIKNDDRRVRDGETTVGGRREK